MSVLVVDWLGRGGIAQCVEAWAMELERNDVSVAVATRADRELASNPLTTITTYDSRQRLLAHARLVRRVANTIKRERPDVVVLQNYLVPHLEELVFRAARRAGSRMVLVIHNHQHHTRSSGLHAGLSRQIKSAEVLLAHSSFVADRLASTFGRRPGVLPLPIPLGMLKGTGSAPQEIVGADPLALHFGVLTRAEPKGTDVAMEIARQGVPGWTIGFIGVGAPEVRDCPTYQGFLSSEDLVAAVSASAATVLPYRAATQSAAVLLAQVAGSIPVATSVGAIPEQIDHDRTGLLLEPGAPVSAWVEALSYLTPTVRARISAEASRAAWEEHETFVELMIEATIA